MKKRGISLIVLIITIVVIIILATAIIVNLAQTNIIGNANEAVVKQDFKTFQEELNLYIADKYADTLGEFDSYSLNANSTETLEIIKSLKDTKYEGAVTIVNGKIAIDETKLDAEVVEMAKEVIEDSNTTYQKIVVDTYVTNVNGTLTGENPTYNNPVVPVGFKAVNTAKATWSDTDGDGAVDGWNNGLVIKDSSENEYVWVPVDGTNITYAKRNSNVNTSYTVTAEQTDDKNALPSGVSSETEQITKYGGFYVARYEASLPDSATTDMTKVYNASNNNATTLGKAQSKANKLVWNWVNWTNAKTLSENVVTTANVKSGLITGTQWDTMVKFIEQEVGESAVLNDSTSWGNYYTKYGYTIKDTYYMNSGTDGNNLWTFMNTNPYTYADATTGYTKSGNGYLLLNTGVFGSVVTEGSPKNLYDVSGNTWEWTTEEVIEQGGTNAAVGNKLLRGGSFNYDGSFCAASRNGDCSASNTLYSIGFRFVLYIL